MLRVIKILLFLVVILAAIVVGYAYLGDLTPAVTDVDEPIDFDATD